MRFSLSPSTLFVLLSAGLVAASCTLDTEGAADDPSPSAGGSTNQGGSGTAGSGVDIVGGSGGSSGSSAGTSGSGGGGMGGSGGGGMGGSGGGMGGSGGGGMGGSAGVGGTSGSAGEGSSGSAGEGSSGSAGVGGTDGSCGGSKFDCDGDSSNGCEVDLQTDTAHCGECGNTCPSAANATPACQQGACGLHCVEGYADCDNDPSNGCEINLQTDVAHCGMCISHCEDLPHSQTVCTQGTCAIGSCATGFEDCDQQADNGCETAVSADINNCGSCGNQCPTITGGTSSCNNGQCATTCNASLANCDADLANGCETNIYNDAKNCGACGHDCGDSECNNGYCKPTTIGSEVTAVVDLQVDNTYVYWLDSQKSSLSRANKAGGSQATLGSNLVTPLNFALGVNYVFVATHGVNPSYAGKVVAVPKAQGNSTDVDNTVGKGQYGIDIIDSTLYWSRRNEGTIYRRPLGSTNASNEVFISSENNPGVLHAANGKLYFVQLNAANGNSCETACDFPNAKLRYTNSLDKNGLQVKNVVAQAMPNLDRFVIAGDEAILALHGKPPARTDASVVRVNLSTSAVTSVVTNQPYVTDVAADNDYIYWTLGGANGDGVAGGLMRVARNTPNAQPEKLVATGKLTALALDAGYVYFANATTGTISRLAK